MSATDELRRLLDERGVEWMPSAWSARDETFYKVGNTGFLATEMSGGRMKVCIEGYVVPEQAVEATLGTGTCNRVREYFGRSGKSYREVCSECHHIIYDGWQDKPRYCPFCGRKVVDA